MKAENLYLTLPLLSLIVLTQSGCERANASAAEPARPTVRVQTIVAAEREFIETIPVQGVVRAVNSARVAARVAGTIEALRVVEGQSVTNGQPLFLTDRITAQEVARLREEDRLVAAAGLREAEAALAEAEAILTKAEADQQRMHYLYDNAKAVTKDAVERADTEFVRAKSALARTKAGLELAAARARQADSSLEIASKQLSDTLVCAPFEGVVVRKMLDVGDFAQVGEGVLELDDTRRYEALYTLSGDHYERVKEGETMVRLANGLTAPVRYRSPTLNPITRTFEIRVDLPRDKTWAAGRLCEATVELTTRRGLGVPDAAVGLRDGNKIVFIVENGLAVQTSVKTGISWQGWTEVTSTNNLAGLPVVAEGQLLLDNGDAVRTE